jgi:hypothetical protein
MNVLITGASGKLGSKVLQILESKYIFTRLGRNIDEYPWQLGVRLDPDQFQNIDAVLHFAWSLHDRANDVHMNVGGTAELARFAKELGIPFIFISSISAGGDSFYGKSKQKAEEYVSSMSGIIFRVGLVLDSNRYTSHKLNWKVNLIPNLKGNLPITDLSFLCDEISKVINSYSLGNKEKSEVMTITSDTISVGTAFGGPTGINLRVPVVIIRVTLKILSPFSLSARNYQDAFKSLKSSLQKE